MDVNFFFPFEQLLHILFVLQSNRIFLPSQETSLHNITDSKFELKKGSSYKLYKNAWLELLQNKKLFSFKMNHRLNCSKVENFVQKLLFLAIQANSSILKTSYKPPFLVFWNHLPTSYRYANTDIIYNIVGQDIKIRQTHWNICLSLSDKFCLRGSIAIVDRIALLLIVGLNNCVGGSGYLKLTYFTFKFIFTQ